MKKEILMKLRQADDYLSGEALSQSLGVTRAAVNKQIMTLRALGYEIDSLTNRGYLLRDKPMMNQLELEIMLEDNDIRLVPQFFDSIDSTNQFAKTIANESLIVALEQTKGRGRRGRDWVSEKNKGLYYSLALTPTLEPKHIASITQLVGLCIARALGDEAMIKWPNDVFIHGKKVSGILAELITQADYIEKLIIGIGINFSPVNNMATATSLAEEGIELSMLEVLTRFLQEFYQVYPQFLQTPNLSYWLDEINQRSFLQGKSVHVVGGDIKGVFSGIDAQGQAIVQADKRYELSYGEISLRGYDETT